MKELPSVPCKLTDFDAEPYTIQAPSENGAVAVNLKTGSTKPVVPGDMCLRITGATYNEEATCNEFLKVVDKACCGDKELALYMQKQAGYFCVGHNYQEELYIDFGSGANFKSTKKETIREVLGSYAKVALPSLLLSRKSGAATNDLAGFVGTRAVFLSESDDGDRLADGFLKYITSNEEISCRFLHKEFFRYKPQFKISMGTNHKPLTRATDEGLWRRLALIPFRATIPEDERIADFRQRYLVPEHSGVLRQLAINTPPLIF